MADKQRTLHWIRDAISMANEACGFTSPLWARIPHPFMYPCMKM